MLISLARGNSVPTERQESPAFGQRLNGLVDLPKLGF